MTTIADLRFDDKNFNRHTSYGMGLLEKSLRENGAGRSILIDADTTIGKKCWEWAEKKAIADYIKGKWRFYGK